MLASPYFIPATELWSLIGTAAAPQIIDARRREVYEAGDGVLPTAA
jgi:hypothetical protein